MNVARLHAPVGMIVPKEVQDLAWVCILRLSHPDPNESVFFDNRVTAYTGIGWYLVLAWDFDALAGAVEFHAVVHAPNSITFLATMGQRCSAVTTLVCQRNDLVLTVSVKQNGLAQQCASHHFFLCDFVVPTGHVPTFKNEVLTEVV
jgi:hypothetical protein